MVRITAACEPVGEFDMSGDFAIVVSRREKGGKAIVLGQADPVFIVEVFAGFLECMDELLENVRNAAEGNDRGVKMLLSVLEGEFKQFMRANEAGERYEPLSKERTKPFINERFDTPGEEDSADNAPKPGKPKDPWGSDPGHERRRKGR